MLHLHKQSKPFQFSKRKNLHLEKYHHSLKEFIKVCEFLIKSFEKMLQKEIFRGPHQAILYFLDQMSVS